MVSVYKAVYKTTYIKWKAESMPVFYEMQYPITLIITPSRVSYYYTPDP